MRSCPRCKTPYTTEIEFCGIDGQRLVDVDNDPLIGATIDRYRVVERIGGGGMGAVYRAVHTVIDRQCALKVLFGELASDRAFAERFRREAQAASRIKHEGVVEVLDFGTTPEGASFLLMELLEGQPLSSLIGAAGPLEPPHAARIARDVAAGLSAAHALGFVHRDLKPQNIMLVVVGGVERAKILDFGLVASTEKKDDGNHLTKTGQTLGTPSYMAPEQLEGLPATERTDLYALGVILHEMLSGVRPFEGSLADVIQKHVSQPPPPLPPSQGLEGLVAGLLEKSPAKRPQSAVAVVRAIEQLGVLGDVPPLALPEPPGESPKTRSDRVAHVSAAPSGSALFASGSAGASELFTSGSGASELLSSVPSASLPSPAVRAAAAALTEAHTVSPSGSNALPPRGAPSASAATVRHIGPPPAGARFPRGLIVGAVATVAALAAISFGLDVAGIRRALLPVHEAAENVGAKAVTATLTEPAADSGVGDAENIAAALAELERDITSAFEKRGLVRADAAHLAELRTALARFDEAKARGDAAQLRNASAALLKEIARAPISARVADAAIARAADAVKASTHGPRKRAELGERLTALRARAKSQRTEAERSRNVLDAAALVQAAR